MAAQSYFGKSANELTLEEGALLAGLTKGPNYYSPDRHPGRAQERLAYVLSRMQEDGAIGPEQAGRRLPALPALAAYKPRRDIGFHFSDQVAREAKAAAGIDAITANSYTVRSTINTQLQRAVEQALQEGPVALRAQRRPGLVPVRRRQSRRRHPAHRGQAPSDRQEAGLAAGARERAAAALRRALDAGRGAREAQRQAGARPGASACATAASCRSRSTAAPPRRKLALHDVVFVRVTEGKSKSAGARRAAGAAGACRARRWCWRTRPAASSRCRAAFPIR